MLAVTLEIIEERVDITAYVLIGLAAVALCLIAGWLVWGKRRQL